MKQVQPDKQKAIEQNELFNRPDFCVDPAYNGKNMTNRVIREEITLTKYKNMKQVTYYCPCYVKMKIKNFKELNLTDMNAVVNCSFEIHINFRGVSPGVQNYIRDKIRLSFGRNDSFLLNDDSDVIFKDNSSIFCYTLRKFIDAAIIADALFSPFEILYLLVSLNIQGLDFSEKDVKDIMSVIKKYNQENKQERYEQMEQMKKKKQKDSKDPNKPKDPNKYKGQKERIFDYLEQQLIQLNGIKKLRFRFNCMDSVDQFEKINFTAEGTFGQYDLAEKLLKVQFAYETTHPYISSGKKGNQKKDRKKDQSKKAQKQKQKRMRISGGTYPMALDVDNIRAKEADYSVVKPFSFCHFEIPVYKMPLSTVMTVFFPLLLLALINFGIFFTEKSLSKRLATISSLMIAFVSLIPVIREKLPQTSRFTMIEIVVYMITLTTLLCFIQSMAIRNQTESPNNLQFIWYQNGLCMATFIIYMFCCLVMLCFAAHYTYKKFYKYNMSSTEVNSSKAFEYEKWENANCDRHFIRKLDTKAIQVVRVDKGKELLKEFIYIKKKVKEEEEEQ